MKLSDVKNELFAIGKTYPSLLGLMKKQLGGSTVGEHWATILLELDPFHFADVCGDFAALRLPIPEQVDRLPFAIKAEVLRRCDAAETNWEMHVEKLRRELVKGGDNEARSMPHERIVAAWREKMTTKGTM